MVDFQASYRPSDIFVAPLHDLLYISATVSLRNFRALWNPAFQNTPLQLN